MSIEIAETVILFGAKDSTGRLYLLDDPTLLPVDAIDVQELEVTPERMEWNILSVQIMEMLRVPVAIHVGDYHYETSPPDSLSVDRKKKATLMAEHKTVSIQVATFEDLFDVLPQEWKTDTVRTDLLAAYRCELHYLLNAALHPDCREPRLVLRPWRQGGRQLMAEFWVADAALDWKPTSNLHGQNVSQWRYGGAIVLQGGEVSTHH